MNNNILLFASLILFLSINGFTQEVKLKSEVIAIQHGISFSVKPLKIRKKLIDIEHYFVSEKLDGMRGYWNGKHIYSRKGHKINSPKWFTQGWPNIPMDGEMWIARDKYQQLLSCVRRKTPGPCWKKVKFMIFDLPNNTEMFSVRVDKMEQLTSQVLSPYLQVIKQEKVSSLDELYNRLNTTIAKHGEGLMLHRDNAYYIVGRNPALLKLKKNQDAEAEVIAHIEGKGKYKGLLGSLKVKNSDGIIFKIGSGFNDKERENPPKVGSTITYIYNGYTQSGIPRFARYWRLRPTKL